MAQIAGTEHVRHPAAARPVAVSDRPAYQAYQILHTGFALLPIIAGADKFLNRLVDWEQYLAPTVTRLLAIDATTFMRAVGVVEIVAGLVVAFWPRWGGYLVAAWLWGIIVNLFMIPGYYDIMLRDFGLSLGALAVARLGAHFHHRAAT